MTGDSEKIEEVVSKVDCLVLDIETVRFDPYNPLNRSASTTFCCSFLIQLIANICARFHCFNSYEISHFVYNFAHEGVYHRYARKRSLSYLKRSNKATLNQLLNISAIITMGHTRSNRYNVRLAS